MLNAIYIRSGPDVYRSGKSKGRAGINNARTNSPENQHMLTNYLLFPVPVLPEYFGNFYYPLLPIPGYHDPHRLPES
jgi:hypothetical protein